jgi:microcystin-dependent protein
MADQFVGEIRIFPFNFAPSGWALCDGQLMAISQNTALFSLLGTQFGGNGQTTFGLPNLQGSAPVNQGQGSGLSDYVMGEIGGEPAVTLLTSQLPSHGHTVNCSTSAASQPSPIGNVWAVQGTRGAAVNLYSATAGTSPVMNGTASGLAGSGNPHNNMSPCLTLNFCIALQGIFPARG